MKWEGGVEMPVLRMTLRRIMVEIVQIGAFRLSRKCLDKTTFSHTSQASKIKTLFNFQLNTRAYVLLLMGFVKKLKNFTKIGAKKS